MNMKKLQKIFVILCAFIMLLSVNYSVNAIDTSTPGSTTTETTTTSTPGSTPAVATPTPTPTTTPSTPIDPNAKVSFSLEVLGLVMINQLLLFVYLPMV